MSFVRHLKQIIKINGIIGRWLIWLLLGGLALDNLWFIRGLVVEKVWFEPFSVNLIMISMIYLRKKCNFYIRMTLG